MSGLHLILFLFYCLLFCFIIFRSQSFQNATISRPVFIGAFLLKIGAAVLYGYIYSRQPYIKTSDVWDIFNKSLLEYHRLFQDPVRFLKTMFIFEGDISYTNFTETQSSYWNILKEVILIKFEAILNIFSFGNYYVNTVLFGFLIFASCNLLFKALESLFPGRSCLNLFASFLVPSTVFWTSAVYKDGLLFCLISLIVYQTVRWLDGGKKSFPYWSVIFLCLVTAFLLRTYVALLVAPALAAWILTEKWHLRPAIAFASVYAIGGLLVVFSRYIYPPLDMVRLLAVWQHSFLALKANSAMPAERLEPTLLSVLKNVPQAINFGFLRPVLWENKGEQYLPFAAELLVIQALVVFAFFSKPKLTIRQTAFRLFCFCLAISGCLFLGYVVHIIGALVRYRSIFFPFLFTAILCTIPWPIWKKKRTRDQRAENA